MRHFRLENGVPVLETNEDAFSEWMGESWEERKIGFDKLNTCEVSTCFIGRDMSGSNDGPAYLWETLVFGGIYDGDGERYCSAEDAANGHQRYVRRVLDSGDMTQEEMWRLIKSMRKQIQEVQEN